MVVLHALRRGATEQHAAEVRPSARLDRRAVRRCKYCTMACPVLTGNGSSSMRLPLVHFNRNVPLCQLRSSNWSRASGLWTERADGVETNSRFDGQKSSI